jgi:hypothetical protein
MQARSTCGIGHISSFWTRGVTHGIWNINPCCTCPWRGGPGYLPHICGKLSRALALKGGEYNTHVAQVTTHIQARSTCGVSHINSFWTRGVTYPLYHRTAPSDPWPRSCPECQAICRLYSLARRSLSLLMTTSIDVSLRNQRSETTRFACTSLCCDN